MKLNIIFATLAAAALTACSSDALVEEKAVSTEAITFNTYTGGVSRSADYYCNALQDSGGILRSTKSWKNELEPQFSPGYP